ncbi:hypothetical protein [Hydrogenispora ethanolica]|jgi:hypothetical protein|uniref:hypothetical protein n=1 Tax=Hydrogenispora ethanolica TaxID=1082276 RepID=UPI00104B74D0|nr:hypothetical protein [Hydrogenispora ethanolica]
MIKKLHFDPDKKFPSGEGQQERRERAGIGVFEPKRLKSKAVKSKSALAVPPERLLYASYYAQFSKRFGKRSGTLYHRDIRSVFLPVRKWFRYGYILAFSGISVGFGDVIRNLGISEAFNLTFLRLVGPFIFLAWWGFTAWFFRKNESKNRAWN